ncbi:Condensin-2 complex subunit like [Actinidia chinensis var. chinensis]|uniref:Condensin-2 complex subunit like n=1 Tax=Actinidia chinensis var. chinensis TaxID=1590841 RepID=A0A2R6PA82_ACTCC|nr:Condensin-2 complex subunit like [Actinidia chinensis var. chinensis]
MEKRLRSSLQTSADEFLSTAAKLGYKSAKPSLKTLIHSLKPSSELSSSLPLSLLQSISHSVSLFKQSANADPSTSPKSPPTKKLRRSSRRSKTRDESDSKDFESEIVNERKIVIEKLQIYAYVVNLCVSHPKKAFSASDLLPAVRELHDNLVLFESDSALLSEIASLCEEWWREELPGRETLISQSLPFLVSRSLTLKKKVDVHRVYVLREAFALFDFEDESIEDLKLLLIRCLIEPLYLKTEDGRKFIAFVFGLNGQFLKEALAMVRSQIPFERKSMLEAYADIVFRAWRVVGGPLRDEIESGFLQGLVEGAIHASSASFAASIRRVVGGFISQRTVDGVEKLLFRLAEPVIFRSLQVANSNVRQNALHLLLDMFPLEDPDCTKEVKDTLLDKQFFLLERLLMDECPDVRVVAVEGSCRILHLFWEIIPSSTITKIITKIFDDMTHDQCNEVRLSTLNGIIYLLGNPQSHEILKVLLPRLGHLILDPGISVRVALIDLLLLSGDIRTFQFHKVVRLDLLLSTLANDQPLIAQKITKLLMPSYFPSKVTLEEACNRCVTLIKRSPMAGARFCEFALSEGASYQSLMELVKVFISLVVSCNKLEGDQIDGLLVAAAYLCNNLVSEASYKATLKELFSAEILRCLFGAAANRRAQSSVCDIISCVSPDDIGGVFEECMTLVTNCCGLSEDTEKQVEVRSAHKMLLSCNWFDDMFESLIRILQKTAHECHSKFGTEIARHIPPFPKRGKSKSSIKISMKGKHVSGKRASPTASSTFEEDYSIALGIAWQIKDLLVDEIARKVMLESQILETAFFALKIISEVSIVQCMQCDYMDTSPILAYTTLTLHASLQNVGINGVNNHGSKKKACTDSVGPSSEATNFIGADNGSSIQLHK